MQSNRAQSGAAVVLDIATGEVLAMVNQPSFNPNDREQYAASRYRNRAATDIFEPGSSIKPFVVAAAMETGRYDADTLIETSPGTMRVGSKTIQDKHNLGTIDVTTVLAKSSNVGVVKIALTLKPEEMWTRLRSFRLRSRDGQRLSGRVGRSRARIPALAPDRAGDDVLRLRTLGHAAAARAGLRRARLRRGAPARQHAQGRHAAARRTGARRFRRARAGPHDAERGERGRHRAPRRPSSVTASRARRAPRGKRPAADTRGTATCRCSAVSCRRATRGSRR